MRKSLPIAAAFLLSLPATAFAHRLDEYLQATILSVEQGRIEGSMRLVPGVAVSSTIIANIDTNGDGTLSEAEQQAYAQHVLTDLSLSIDSRRLALHLASASFPAIDEMKQGGGEIQLHFTAAVPRGGTKHSLLFENRHEPKSSVYLVNSLVPRDPELHIAAQRRNENQSIYQLDFEQGTEVRAQPLSSSLSGLTAAFRLGVQHIAEGADHLLFLFALLLPTPLLASAGRWRQSATIRRSLLHILRIVTAFTVGHSLTLALAALGMVRLPSRPVEVLIAISILVSALHAIRPIFPRREALIGAFFGLIHGLAFATALSDLGFGQWYRFVSILGFNLGIEAMQLAVVAAILPLLLLVSRTRAYSAIRIAATLFAVFTAMGWTIERLLDGQIVSSLAAKYATQYTRWIAAAACLITALSWLLRRIVRQPTWAEISAHNQTNDYRRLCESVGDSAAAYYNQGIEPREWA
jgi:hydrogenase/urease accessory protein HupE